MNKEKNAFMEELSDLVKRDDISNENVINMYAQHSTDYDQSMCEIEFKAHVLAAQYFAKHAERFGLGKDCAILDVGAGTGRAGHLLSSQFGFTTIDGIDPCEQMLARARDKNVYRNLHVGSVGPGNRIPVADDTYDGVVVAGCLLPGHMSPDAFLEIIRVVRPGGIIVNAMREEFSWQSKTCDVRRFFAKWEMEGRWNIVEWTIPDDKYYSEKDGLVHVYKVAA